MKEIRNSLSKKIRRTGSKVTRMLVDNRGDLATNTIGGIIVAVVIIGLLIVAVNAFFPDFFSDMFGKMSDKLNTNW